MADEERQDETPEADEQAADSPQPPAEQEQPPEPEQEQPAAEPEPPAAEQEQPAPEQEQPAEPEQLAEAEEPAEPDQPTADSGQPAESEQPVEPEQPRERERRPREDKPADKPEVVPGAHLEPDLVLEEQAAAETEFPGYQEDVYEAQPEAAEAPAEAGAPTDGAPSETPAPRTPVDLAADARYFATGKRKTSVARVILRPGSGAYTINGRALDEFFPRPTLQKTARQPLETAGYETRMDVIAKIHGGGVSAQAGALRHGVARALVEADPSLRGELKRHGFLTRDARAKERKKAGLKKARKRPQFSKR